MCLYKSIYTIIYTIYIYILYSSIYLLYIINTYPKDL